MTLKVRVIDQRSRSRGQKHYFMGLFRHFKLGQRPRMDVKVGLLSLPGSTLKVRVKGQGHEVMIHVLK